MTHWIRRIQVGKILLSLKTQYQKRQYKLLIRRLYKLWDCNKGHQTRCGAVKKRESKDLTDRSPADASFLNNGPQIFQRKFSTKTPYSLKLRQTDCETRTDDSTPRLLLSSNSLGNRTSLVWWIDWLVNWETPEESFHLSKQTFCSVNRI